MNQDLVQKLKGYFEKREDVVMAFVFGSIVKENTMPDSDIDIAVYFKLGGKRLEWEEEKFWPEEEKIWSDIEKILDANTDLLVLNRASSSIAFNVLQTGKPIIIKDKFLYLRFFLTISSAAIDFREFIKDYRLIRDRSFSLTDEDKIRLDDLIDFLNEEIKYYEQFYNLDQLTYERDRAQKRNVEHWVESIVVSSIDIAKIILSSEKISLPGNYREILEYLALLGNFDKNIAKELGVFAKLRNIITHEYLDIRWQQIQKFITTSKSLYEYLVNFAKKQSKTDEKK